MVVIYVITAVISMAIAFLLVHLARLSGQAKRKFDKKRETGEYSASNIPTDENLKRVVSQEISEVIDSRGQRDEISKRISSVFNKELEKRIDLNSQKISEKYEKLIDQKGKAEEIAWKKYNKVLTDKKRTETVIRSIAEGLIVVDSKGKVMMMNPAAEKLLGTSKKDKVGKSLLDNLKEEQLISLVKESPDKEKREIELISKQDETKKILTASSGVIEDEHGQTVGMVSVLSDITKQKELDHMKSNFVANVTHELRTPLVAIEKSLFLILSKTAGEISKPQEQFITIAQRNLKRLSILINDLLDLSKLEVGKMELKCEPTSIEGIIKEALESLETWAKTKSITIEKNIQENLSQVNVDANRITQVLNNIVGNAIKFTPKGGNITVEALLDKNGGGVEVSVENTGEGIPKEDLAKIFSKFYQIEEKATSEMNGTGIGLSVAKEIVELHGGKIWAESEKGKNAKFIFTLPLSSSANKGG